MYSIQDNAFFEVGTSINPNTASYDGPENDRFDTLAALADHRILYARSYERRHGATVRAGTYRPMRIAQIELGFISQ
jgi:hypothetical protein